MAASIGAARIELSINSAEFEAQMQRARASVGKFRASLNNVKRNFEKTGKQLTSTGRAWTTGFTLPALAAGGAAIKAGIDFQTAFAGVRKTVDATESQFASMKQEIRDMAKEIPTTANEIASIAESAGQLGIQNNKIMGFTRVMADLGVTTNMTSNEAATAGARFANITQMSQKNFDRLGSTVVDLGNNLATTEGEIMDMGLRLAGSGRQAGLAESQILGIAGALSSVGLESQAGGTAFSKVMDNINLAVKTGSDSLTDFADVAGMTRAQFVEAFEKDAAGAIISFVEGLGDMEKRGSSAIETLEKMGISERRMRDALLRASGAGDILRESIELGSKAWEENIALAEEAAQRYETDASQIEILRNEIYDLGITLSEALMPAFRKAVDVVKRATQWVSALSDESLSLGLSIMGIAAAVGPTLMLLGKLSGAIAMIMNPVGLVITGMAAVATAVYTHWDEITQLFSNEGPEFMEPVRTAMDSIVRFARTTIENLKKVFKAGLRLLAVGWVTFGDSIVGSIKVAWTAVTSIIGAGLEGLSVILDVWSGRWLSDWEGFLSDVKTSLTNVFGEGGFARTLLEEFFKWFLGGHLVTPINAVGGFLGFDQLIGDTDKMKKEAKEAADFVNAVFGDTLDFASYLVDQNIGEADRLFNTWMGLADRLRNIDFSFSLPNFFGGDTKTEGGAVKEKKSAPVVSLPALEVPEVDMSQYEVVGQTLDDLQQQWSANAGGMKDTWTDFVEHSKAAGFDFANFMSGNVANAISSFSESVGVAMSGAENSFATGLEKVILLVTDFAKQLGSILIGIGTAIAFVPGFQGPAGAYIAAGAALTALASGVAAGIQKRISNRESRASEVNVPGMAHGGIVPPGFPNDSYPAMLTSGERVVPDPLPLSTGGGAGVGMTKQDMFEAVSRALAGAKWKLRGGDLVMVQKYGEGKYG